MFWSAFSWLLFRESESLIVYDSAMSTTHLLHLRFQFRLKTFFFHLGKLREKRDRHRQSQSEGEAGDDAENGYVETRTTREGRQTLQKCHHQRRYGETRDRQQRTGYGGF